VAKQHVFASKDARLSLSHSLEEQQTFVIRAVIPKSEVTSRERHISSLAFPVKAKSFFGNLIKVAVLCSSFARKQENELTVPGCGNTALALSAQPLVDILLAAVGSPDLEHQLPPVGMFLRSTSMSYR
jgi:hypothetical protein